MTREYILENLEVMCPIMFIDNPGLRDYVMSTLQESLLIPKHKFGVGDVVKDKNGSYWNIAEYLYDPNKKEWVYYTMMFRRRFYESELELVEEVK